MVSKIRTGLVVAAAALGTAAFAVPAGGAQGSASSVRAPVCRGETIRIDGGTLEYGECSSNGMRQVTGTLNDNKNNDRCVRSKVVFVPNGPTVKDKDCGGAKTKVTTGWHKASDAKVYLSG
ncbi:hypothetical protein [Streptomyces luteolus]|uniref:Secreted protein n=1 Tax=Streptomyces luteolus TaxID=3043615 RepID=A0ABT6ST26_9ACTN|nr:hypothetical protein [Streptomyces sp. B-S-A12]MDI3418268.1 hypothetical protein [Streptomyces sp. B-S-A12]